MRTRQSASQWLWRRSGAAPFLIAVSVLTGCNKPAWNQWGGPTRNFIAPPVRLLDAWPAEGPKVLWSHPIGDGFSTIVGNTKRVYAGYRMAGDREAFGCFDALTGTPIWEYSYEAPFAEGPVEEKDEKTGKTTTKTEKQVTEFGKGPNATPLLVGDRLFTLGFTGKLHCLDASDGELIWSRDLYQEMHGSYQRFGWAASPIAYRDTIIILLGGHGQGIVALRQKDGVLAWKSTHFDASYSSPIIVNFQGTDHLIAYMASELVGVSPRTGYYHWSLPHGNMYKTSIATPVWCPGNQVYFVNGGDTAGGRMVKLTYADGRIATEEVWKNDKLRGGLNNAVLVGDYFYGPNSAGEGAKFMVCADARTGEIKWRNRDVAGAAPIFADGKLILLDEEGHLILARPNPEALDVLAKVKLLEKPSWTTPTLIGTKLYLRDRKTMMALELGPEK